MSKNWQPSSQRWASSSRYGSVSQRIKHHEQATRTTILKSLCHPGVSPCRLKAITTEEKSINETFQIQSGLLTGIAATEKRFFAHADEKLTASMELEAAIRACGELPRQANLTRGKFATYSSPQ